MASLGQHHGKRLWIISKAAPWGDRKSPTQSALYSSKNWPCQCYWCSKYRWYRLYYRADRFIGISAFTCRLRFNFGGDIWDALDGEKDSEEIGADDGNDGWCVSDVLGGEVVVRLLVPNGDRI